MNFLLLLAFFSVSGSFFQAAVDCHSVREGDMLSHPPLTNGPEKTVSRKK
jgi:hypothetical protein